MRIGLCTGGGDCPGLNAAIRAVVKHAVGTYRMEVVGIRDSFDGLVRPESQTVPLKLDEVTAILDRGGTILGTRNSGSPFGEEGVVGSKNGAKVEAIIAGYKKMNLDGLIVVGGDGTQRIASEFVKRGFNIVGVPKTIDNDLAGTEQTIGFATAVDIAADALIRLGTTAESHERIMILEVMGRNAGHIALHTGLAGGAHIILLPELPFAWDPIVAKVEERKALGRYFSLVVVAEGAHPQGGQQVYKDFGDGVARLGGIGQLVAHELAERTKMETRVTVLGHIQRGGQPSPHDRVLASAFGAFAVDLVAAKKFGRVVTLQNHCLVDEPYDRVAGHKRPVDLGHYLVRAAENIGICIGRHTDFDARRDLTQKK